jgi:uncharacterized membrane protein
MRRILLAAAPILLIAVAPTSSQADAVGAAFGVGTGLVVARPVGAVVGGVVGAVGDSMALHRPLRSFFNSLSDDLSRGSNEL